MDDFLMQQNLARFRRQLTETVEDSTRRILLTLLAEEKAKELERYQRTNDRAQKQTDDGCQMMETVEQEVV